MIMLKHVEKLKFAKTEGKQVWTTPAGEMKTAMKVRGKFTLPELHDNHIIEWACHVTKDLGVHDMIIGRDVLKDLE